MTMKEVHKSLRYPAYKYGEAWGSRQCLFYNGLLRVEMVPTRFMCKQTLQKMGILAEVESMLEKMGLGHIAHQPFPLFPELARQFLASAELRYEDGGHTTASGGMLSFFCNGILYDISIRELCDLYGFDRSIEGCGFPYDDFPQVADIWDLIGTGGYESRGAKLSHIRNPVVRVVAKIIGETFSGKEESGAVRLDELMLLHYGLPSFVRDIYRSPPPSTLRTNLGAIFADTLVLKKGRGLNTVRRKVERIGSLLTPIFLFKGVDLSSASCVPQFSYFDEQYFRASGILKPGFVYQFQDRSGEHQFCRLPLPEFTAPTSRRNLDFVIPSEYLTRPKSARRRRGSSSRPSTSEPHLEDERVPDDLPQHRQSAEYTEPTLPEYTGEYDLAPLSADASSPERSAWIVDSLRKNHSMMRRMWEALSRPRCPRPPSCFRAAEHRDDTDRPTPTADIPDVAGHRTTDAGVSDEQRVQTDRPPRRRHIIGASESASSDETL